jgi:hypothetical protein
MTTRYKRNKTLMAKIETTYGVDAVPTGAANAILCKTDVRDAARERARPREVIQAYMGHQQDLPVATRMKSRFDVECGRRRRRRRRRACLGPALARCGFAQTVNAAVSVSYAPISTGLRVAHHLLQPGRRAVQDARLPRQRLVQDDAARHPVHALLVPRGSTAAWSTPR